MNQCSHEVKLEGVQGIFFCVLKGGHRGPCVLNVLGSDEFNAWLGRVVAKRDQDLPEVPEPQARPS